MTSVRLHPQYQPHLWYPILVKIGGNTHIVEMLGAKLNTPTKIEKVSQPIPREEDAMSPLNAM